MRQIWLGIALGGISFLVFIWFTESRRMTQPNIDRSYIASQCGILDSDDLAETAMHKIAMCIKRLNEGIPYSSSIGMDDKSNPDFKIYVDPQYPSHIIIGSNPNIDFVEIGCLYNNPFSNNAIPYFCDKGAITKIEHGSVSNEWVIFKSHSKWAFHNGPTMEDIWIKPLEINQ